MLTFVVPVLNEEESLNAFYKELKKTINELEQDYQDLLPCHSREGGNPDPSKHKNENPNYEIIFIDDGSTDHSLDILKKLAKEDPAIKIFSFRRNLGKAEAITLGFIKSKGDYVITLDADLQDKPSQIHKLLSKAKDGIEVVSGWRKDRRDKSKMKIISRLFNTIMGRLFDLSLHDYNCGLKLYTRDAAKSLRLYGGLHRFIPLLAYEQGFTVDEVAIEHAPRAFGKSKYSFSKLWKDLPDMFTLIFLVKYGKRPLHFFGIIGGTLALTGFIILFYLTMLHFLGARIGDRPLLFLGMLLTISGFQIFFTGFLADLMIHISKTRESLDESRSHFPIKFSSEK